MFVNLLLWTIYLLIAATIVLTVWSAIRSFKQRGGSEAVTNNVPARRLTIAIAVGIIVLLGLTFLLASTSALTINGREYTDAFWLRTSDMLINSSIALIIVAVVSIVVSRIIIYKQRS